MKIVAVEPIGISCDKALEIKSLFAVSGHDFVFYPDRKEDVDTLVERMQDADIVIISNIGLNAEILSQCSNLKMISVAFTGLDHIDLDYCKKNNIHIYNASGYATIAVCELTIGLILDVYRHITVLDLQTRKEGTRNNFLGKQIFGKTAGIVGTGAIGTQVAITLKQMGANVIAWSRSKNEKITANNIPYCTLDELFRLSDIITLHLPLTTDTYHLVDKQKLSLCKNGAILINTARGNIVDTQALAEALNAGRLGGAGIDVFEKEPPISKNHPLFSAQNAVVVPHIGYATEEAFQTRIDIVLNNIFRWLESL